MPLGHQEELHRTIAMYQGPSRTRLWEEGVLRTRLSRLSGQCRWVEESGLISLLSGPEVTSLSLLIQKQVDQLASWISSIQDAIPSDQQDTDAEQ